MPVPDAFDVASGSNSSGTSLAITLPAGTNFKMAVICIDGGHAANAAWPSGWTGSFTDRFTNCTYGFAFSDAAIADTSVTVTWTGTERANALGIRVSDTDVDFTVNPPIEGTEFGASTSTPDPPDLTGLPSDDYRVMAVAVWNDGTTSVTAYPEADNNDTQVDGFSPGTGVAIATVGQTSITSYNPGTFTLDATEQGVTNTIAIREGAAAAAVYPPFPRRQNTLVRM